MKLKKHINITIIAILILISALLIGTPIKESNVYVIYAVAGIFSIYYFTMAIIGKNKIILDKVDILIGILVLSSVIPLIFRTYVSLSETVYGIIQYFCLYSIYLIAKNECKKEPKYIWVLINSIIFGILILCVIGLDEINGNFLEKFKNFINYIVIEYDERRITSLFAYPNTMAAVAGMGIFLTFACFFKSKKKIVKILYIIIAIIMLCTLILTYSRLVYIFIILFILIFLVALAKKYNLRKRLNRKSVSIIAIVSIAFIAYIAIGLQIPDKVEIKENYQKIMYSVESNTTYKFSFNIDAISETEDNFLIKITEKNKYFDDLKTTQIEFGTLSGIKEIEIKTEPDTQVIYLNIERKKYEGKLIINEAYLNEEKFILKYKLLPTGIVQKVQGISFNNKSVWERTAFITDALKAIKDNWILGSGGNAWETVQNEVQSYNYQAKEVHSFIVQTFLENGILGVLAWIGIIFYLLKKLIGEYRKECIDIKNVSIMLAVLFILTHSLLDFNMSFFYVVLIVSILIAILSIQEDEKTIKYNKVIYAILIIISVFNIYTCCTRISYENYIDKRGMISYSELEKICETYYRLIPFDKEIKLRYYESIATKADRNSEQIKNLLEDIINNEKYDKSNVILEYINFYLTIVLEQNNNMEKSLDFIINYINETEKFFYYNPDLQLNRLTRLLRIYNRISEKEELSEYKLKIKEQLVDEINKKEVLSLDCQKCRYSVEKVDTIQKQFENLKQKINI